MRCRIPREGFNDLLGCPLGGWVLSNVEMYDAASIMGQDDQHEEHLEGGRGHGEKVAGDQVIHVICQESFPRW